MHVIFVEPSFPRNQRQFPRALKEAGATVSCIGEASPGSIDGDLGRYIDHFESVSSVCHVPSMIEAVKKIQRMAWVDRIEATVEAHIMPVAKVREACSIPGTSVATAWLCRDKPTMKEALRKADIPCALSTGAATADEVRAFAKEVGYPVIVKPRDGAGASGTYRCANDEELDTAIEKSQLDRGASVAVEEFIEGHEGFYDTLTHNGEVIHEFVTHYFPNVLEAMRTRWISPQFITTNRSDEEGYAELKKLGRRVIQTLGIETSATHMEWFYGAKGLKFSEIGCRPPGVSAWDLYAAANEIDIYREWAELLVSGKPRQRLSGSYSAGIINIRPTEDGTIVGCSGLDEIREAFGDALIDFHIPPAGSPTQPVDAGYMANAWIRMKHRDYDQLRKMLNHVGETVKLIAR